MQTKIALIVFLLIISQINLWAKEVEISPAISMGVGYSDNIRLDDTNERSSAYTRIMPSIRFSREGARVKADLNYSLTGIFYNSESDLDEIQHRLFANANSELVKSSIFLDTDATITQELLDSQYSSSSDGVSGSQNLTQTYTYRISPYWKKNWNNFAKTKLQYSYDEVIFDDSSDNYSGINNNGGDDSARNRYILNVDSGVKFRRYFWNFNYQYNDISYKSSSNRDTRSEGYKVLLGYHFSRRIDFTYTTGYENYNDGRDDGGTGWRAGVIWNPTTRTNLKAEAGRRFFGRTYLLDFRHRSKRFTWRFNYDDSVTDTRSSIVNNNDSIISNPGVITTPLSSNFSAQFFLSRRFTGNVSYKYKKSVYSLGLFNERRYYYDSDKNDESDLGMDLSWNLRVGRRTNMDTRFSFTRLDNKTGVNSSSINNQDRIELNWSINHRMTPDMTGSLTISYRDNSADIKTYEYTEHAIFMNVVKRF